MNDRTEFVKEHRVVIIYRGLDPEDCLEASRALAEAGLRMFEVTMNSRDTARAIEMLDTELGSEALIGAGTVMTPEQVEAASSSGASYIVSPNTNIKVIERTKELGLLSVPGAFTPTEVRAAWEAGADFVKVFPINVVGAEYITQLRAPLDDIPMMPSGGITLKLAEELSRTGVEALGVGLQMLGKDLLESKDWDALRERGARLLEAAKRDVKL